MKKSTIAIVIAGLALFIPSCSNQKQENQDDSTLQYSEEVAGIIYQATAGSVMPDDKISVFFNESIVSKEALDKEIDNPFNFSPSIKGKAFWSDVNQLTFEPSKPLTSRVNYSGKLNLKKLNKDFEVEEFNMKFYVEGRDVISFNGELELLNPANPKQLVYRGKVSFSQNTKIEDVIKSASFTSSDLNWNQESEKVFSFVSGTITRQSSSKTYDFSINANALNLSEDLDRSIKVVPLQQMQMVSIEKDETGKSPQLMLKFSDQLDSEQNISGFINVLPDVNVKLQKLGKFLVLNGDFKFGNKYTIEIQPGLKSKWGTKTDKSASETVTFSNIEPQVQFSSNGIFMPTSNDKNLQFLTTNLQRVHVEVKKVFSQNIDQFFRNEQLNSKKDRNSEFRNSYITSIGAIIYNQTLEIGGEKNEWLLHNLSLDKVLEKYSNGLYLIRINFNPKDVLVPIKGDELSYIQKSGQVYKPVTISDIGIIAKYTDNQYSVYTTDLRTGDPMSGVKISIDRYNGSIDGTTNESGIVKVSGEYRGSYIKAEKNGQISVIKPHEMRWNKSGFDVGGINSSDLKTRGYIYTERGVYRPGDSINLSSIIRYSSGKRDNVPAYLKLFNPEGTMVYEATQKGASDSFYNFKLATDMNAPTGNWNVQLSVGNKYFYHNLKIETVVANRLKVKVTPSLKTVLPENKQLGIEVESKFLFGASASNLPYTTEVEIFDVGNPFPLFREFNFQNQFVEFKTIKSKITSGNLDKEGLANVTWNIPSLSQAPSPLKAKITATVQEDGGRPNDSWAYVDINPFSHYVGIQNSNTYLKLNAKSEIPIVVVDHKGQPTGGRELVYRIYRNDSYWWYQYDSYQDFRMRFKTDKHTYLIEEGTMSSGKPYAHLPFQPRQKGRYLIEVQDAAGRGHTSGVFVSAYPYGGIPSDDQNAGTLTLKSEKETYDVGEDATITFPSPGQGNVLLTVERGDEILSSKWISPKADEEDMKVSIPITSKMTPNVYVTVTVLQKHSQTINDRPIRMFGILPLTVIDRKSIEELVIDMPDELKPKQKFDIKINTVSGNPTQFTVAVVDEGLLDLTNFKTPDPWKQFFKKVRLGVDTYDLFAFVIGANQGDVFKTFSIGGDADYRESQVDPFEKKKRFKPVSMFTGPLKTDGNGRGVVSFEMPNYVGSVRVMVVSAIGETFGSAEKTVPVKSDLIVLPTIPRALKPGDVFQIPVNVFATRDGLGKIDLTIETEGPLEVVGSSSQSHSFPTEGDKMFYFNAKVKSAIGQAKVTIRAKGVDSESLFEADVPVSPSAARIYAKEEKVIKPGQTISIDLPRLGLDGTNNARLNLSVFPNMDFLHRLEWLIRYPYGCIEQTTSSVFPQLALKSILSADDKLAGEIDKNINAGIERLRMFQLSDGGFSYWPGGDEASPWGSNYAGQFLIEARNLGYVVPDIMYDGIVRYLERETRRNQSDKKWLMTRVNRCFVLAMANKAPLSEMNLIKQNNYNELNSTQKWQLVTAYKLAGAYDKVQDQVASISTEVGEYSEFAHTYGSRYRDLGIILRCLVLLEKDEDAALMAKHIAEVLSGRNWYSTQTLGQMLLGIGNYFEYAGISASDKLIIEGEVVLPNGKKEQIKAVDSYSLYVNEGYGKKLEVTLNNDVNVKQLYATLTSNGVPLIDKTENENKNIDLKVDWFNEDGENIDISLVKQGATFYGRYRVSNVSVVPNIEEVALVQLLPSGWEIENTRLSGEVLPGWMDSFNTGSEEYLDIRDDRIMWFFDLSKKPQDFIVKINAITKGSYQLPGARCEAMYNNDYLATKKAMVVEVDNK
jgi:alpha-2-macroglobulin